MSMNKTTKGALGLGAAAVLLAGGAGSLAYWSGSQTLDGGSITSGELKLTGQSCDTNWVYATGKRGAGNTVVKYVPGDEITKTCRFTVRATGDNLSATLNTPAVTFPTPGAGSTLKLTPTTVYTLGGTTLTNGANTITSSAADRVVTAAITVAIPYGTSGASSNASNENDTQGVTTALNNITVTATQINPN